MSAINLPPARTCLYIREAAQLLRCSEQHLLNRIETGELEAINIGARGKRKIWRIPVHAWDRFLSTRNSLRG